MYYENGITLIKVNNKKENPPDKEILKEIIIEQAKKKSRYKTLKKELQREGFLLPTKLWKQYMELRNLCENNDQLIKGIIPLKEGYKYKNEIYTKLDDAINTKLEEEYLEPMGTTITDYV